MFVIKASAYGFLTATVLWIGAVSPTSGSCCEDERIPFREAMAIASAVQEIRAEFTSRNPDSSLVDVLGELRVNFEYVYYSETLGGIRVEFRPHGAGTMGGRVRYTIETGGFIVVTREFDR